MGDFKERLGSLLFGVFAADIFAVVVGGCAVGYNCAINQHAVLEFQ
jgi:hypothetical protein